jgi:hypothetical protein
MFKTIMIEIQNLGFGHSDFENLKIVSKLGPRPKGGESAGSDLSIQQKSSK